MPRDLYRDAGARWRAVVAWCLYDFANSAYTTLIITLVFSVYFREAVVDAPDNSGDRLWGLANFLAMALVALASPVLGALADYSGRRKFMLVSSTLVTVLATALLFTTTPGHVVWAIVLYVVGTAGFEGGYVFYNSFLHDVATPRTIGRVSGWAWAVGFAGGLTALLICYPWIASELRDPSGRLVETAIRDRRFSFLLVAVFYLLFALPAFFWLRESPPQGPRLGIRAKGVEGFRRVARTLSHLRQYKETGKFVLASLLFNDGISTIIAFSAIYATVTFGFSSAEIVTLFLVLNIVAFPGALAAGYLADAIGARRTLLISLWLWCAVDLTAFLARGRPAFWIMASAAAIGMGSTQAVGRSMMAQLSPPARAAEFFGFYVQSGKLAAMFGPLLFGLVSSATGSQRLAVLSLLPFFASGLALTLSIDENRAQRAVIR